jgi:hypothetical protein
MHRRQLLSFHANYFNLPKLSFLLSSLSAIQEELLKCGFSAQIGPGWLNEIP